MADTTPDLSTYEAEFVSIRNAFARVRQHRQSQINQRITLATEDSQQASTSINNGKILLSPSEWSSEAGSHAAELFVALRSRANDHHAQRKGSLDSIKSHVQKIWTA